MSDVEKYVYRFGAGKAEGEAGMKNLLGGKGANLAEMAKMDLPVPPGFTITTEVCTGFYRDGGKYPATVSRPRSTPPLPKWATPSARNSAMPSVHCWCRCAPAPACRCPA